MCSPAGEPSASVLAEVARNALGGSALGTVAVTPLPTSLVSPGGGVGEGVLCLRRPTRLKMDQLRISASAVAGEGPEGAGAAPAVCSAPVSATDPACPPPTGDVSELPVSFCGTASPQPQLHMLFGRLAWGGEGAVVDGVASRSWPGGVASSLTRGGVDGPCSAQGFFRFV